MVVELVTQLDHSATARLMAVDAAKVELCSIQNAEKTTVLKVAVSAHQNAQAA